jgi:phenylalanyl-tRNA synthetase beta chain
MDIPQEEIIRILTALDFCCAPDGDKGLRVTAPAHRLDVGEGVVGVHDLLEELARVVGYDRIPVTDMADRLPPQRDNAAADWEERLKDRLIVTGLQEVITYRLTTPEREAALSPGLEPSADRAYVRLANPISADRVVMRQTLLAGLLEVMARNARIRDRLWFFELGSVYLPTSGDALPAEPRRLGVAMAGPTVPVSWVDHAPARTDFFVLKGVVEALLESLHLHGVTFEPARHPTFAPGRTARLALGGGTLGILGEVHPAVHRAFDLPAGPVCLAELDLEAVSQAIQPVPALAPVPRFPPVLQDIALVVDDAISAADLTAAIRAAGGILLVDVRLFDVYRGGQLPVGTKSMAFSLAFQAADRTLTDAEVDAAKARIVETVSQRLGARLRG